MKRMFLSIVLVILLLACGNDQTTNSPDNTDGDAPLTDGDMEDCPPGTHLCPCYGNDTCNAGLDCRDSICVESDDTTDGDGEREVDEPLDSDGDLLPDGDDTDGDAFDADFDEDLLENSDGSDGDFELDIEPDDEIELDDDFESESDPELDEEVSDDENGVEYEPDDEMEPEVDVEIETELEAEQEEEPPYEPIWRDPDTLLYWPLTRDAGTWSESEQYCEDLEWGGHSDWRLPTVTELRSLIRGCGADLDSDCMVFEDDRDLGVNSQCIYETCDSMYCVGMQEPCEIEECEKCPFVYNQCYWPEVFGTCPSSADYWSSTAERWGMEEEHWYVGFKHGSVIWGRDSYVKGARCVRRR